MEAKWSQPEPTEGNWSEMKVMGPEWSQLGIKFQLICVSNIVSNISLITPPRNFQNIEVNQFFSCTSIKFGKNMNDAEI